MMLLPAGVLFLSAFINNTLYIQVDPKVREAFICSSVNNENNDTWPSSWKRMNLNNGLHSYLFDDVNNYSIVKYKLRLYYFDRSSVTTEEWIELNRNSEGCNLKTCIILLIIFFVLFICMLGYILFKAYLYYK